MNDDRLWQVMRDLEAVLVKVDTLNDELSDLSDLVEKSLRELNKIAIGD